MNKPAYVLNAIRTPDGTVIASRNRHDYVTHLDKNGEVYMVDGGLDYLRRNVNNEPHEELSVPSTAPFEDIRKAFAWGSRGKDGKQELRYVTLCEMSDDHLDAVIAYLSAALEGMNKAMKEFGSSELAEEPWTLVLFMEEQLYRSKNDISIPE